jgi:hypothetical protein
MMRTAISPRFAIKTLLNMDYLCFKISHWNVRLISIVISEEAIPGS